MCFKVVSHDKGLDFDVVTDGLDSSVPPPSRKIRIIQPPSNFSDDVQSALMDAEIRILDEDQVRTHVLDLMQNNKDVVVAKGLLLRAMRGMLTEKEHDTFETTNGPYIRIEAGTYEFVS